MWENSVIWFVWDPSFARIIGERTNRKGGFLSMKDSLYLFVLVFFSTALTGCEAIGDIFKAGVWVGVLLVILIIGIVVWLLMKPMLWEAMLLQLVNLRWSLLIPAAKPLPLITEWVGNVNLGIHDFAEFAPMVSL
jgi:hypothetical protein